MITDYIELDFELVARFQENKEEKYFTLELGDIKLTPEQTQKLLVNMNYFEDVVIHKPN